MLAGRFGLEEQIWQEALSWGVTGRCQGAAETDSHFCCKDVPGPEIIGQLPDGLMVVFRSRTPIAQAAGQDPRWRTIDLVRNSTEAARLLKMMPTTFGRT
jgi:(p)ppGpp synthase/HD superfamily hydrolase